MDEEQSSRGPESTGKGRPEQLKHASGHDVLRRPHHARNGGYAFLHGAVRSLEQLGGRVRISRYGVKAGGGKDEAGLQCNPVGNPAPRV